MLDGRAASGDRVEAPVDRIAERQRLVAEEIETAAARRLGDRHGLVARVGHPVDREARRPVAHRPLEEVTRGDRAEAREAQTMVAAQTDGCDHPGALEKLRGFLAAPADQLVGPGAREPPDHADTPA